MATIRYSRWDGTQQVFDLDEDDLLAALSDDVLAHGDLARALSHLWYRGFEDKAGDQRVEGLRDLIERLRERRQQQLERHKLDSLMDEIWERLREVVENERLGIERRLEEARREMAESSEPASDLAAAMQVLEERAQRGRETLDNLPESPAGAIVELRHYDFIDSEARRKFQELLDLLSRQMMQNSLENMQKALDGLTPEQIEGLNNMLRGINQMMRDREAGIDPDFEGFMEAYGHHFDPDRPASLDELIDRLREQASAARALVDGMSPEQRAALESMAESVIDPDMLDELAELAARLGLPTQDGEPDGVLQLLGQDPLTLEQAMGLMEQVQDIEDLEGQIMDALRNADLSAIDQEKLVEHLGEDAARQLEQLQRIAKELEDAGYLKSEGDKLELTARGVRKLAQGALREVFAALTKDRLGGHQLHDRAEGGEHTSETRTYEFGDPLDIDLNRTLFNAVLREGPAVPVRISPPDLEVHRTEHLTEAATVLLLDQSRSMGLFGSFTSAKKVALALYWLIQSRFPRDRLYVIGFSDYAIEIDKDDLLHATWNDWVSGTNMHHAFMLARKRLAREKVANRQILMITDGEPTAHLENGRPFFSYPPTYRTIDETLREVKRCTRAGITINTFMLATNAYLMNFIDAMTKINRGRAFYTTPDTLGRYVMVDYLRDRSRRVGS